MAAFFLWCILFIICWPLALLAIVLFPIVWLITLPFRILGIAVHGVFALLAAILFLPARILRARWSLLGTAFQLRAVDYWALSALVCCGNLCGNWKSCKMCRFQAYKEIAAIL